MDGRLPEVLYRTGSKEGYVKGYVWVGFLQKNIFFLVNVNYKSGALIFN